MSNNLEPKALKPVPEYTTSDRFENAIREFGVGNACEWFSHLFDGPFAQDTVELLIERSKEEQQ